MSESDFRRAIWSVNAEGHRPRNVQPTLTGSTWIDVETSFHSKTLHINVGCCFESDALCDASSAAQRSKIDMAQVTMITQSRTSILNICL